jgi:signal transduction histidine kinase
MPLALLCLLALSMGFFQQRIHQIEQLLEQNDQGLREIRLTQQLLLNMESNYNSYIVTRRAEFLRNYRAAKSELPMRFTMLRFIAQRTGSRSEYLDLNQAFQSWVGHSESLFGRPAAEGVAIFETSEFQRVGNLHLDGLRRAFEDFTNQQVARRNVHLARAERARTAQMWYGIGFFALVALFLAWSFRRQLSQAFERYEEQTENLRRSREELKLLVEQKERALESRDEFITLASHELNTPLQTLQLQAEMLRRELKGAEAGQLIQQKLPRYLDREIKQVVRLSQLVKDMLAITKLGRSDITIERGAVHLSDLVFKAAEDLNDLTLASGSVITFELDDRIQVAWDQERMEQVLQNLLANALKYGQGKPITISASLEDDWVKVEVRDQGMGIPATELKRIFGHYERNVSSSEVSGLGLGLFIARMIIEAHGGKIWATSPGPGQGSSFHFELPRSAQLLQGAELGPAETYGQLGEQLPSAEAH